MKPEIQMQRNLMKSALLTLEQMDIVTRLFDGIDNDFKERRLKVFQLEYAETMSKLAGELASIGNEDLKPETSY